MLLRKAHHKERHITEQFVKIKLKKMIACEASKNLLLIDKPVFRKYEYPMLPSSLLCSSHSPQMQLAYTNKTWKLFVSRVYINSIIIIISIFLSVYNFVDV